MTTSNYSNNHKQVYFKGYQNLTKLETALKEIKEESASHFKVSILGKVDKFYSDRDLGKSKDTHILKPYWQDLLGKTVDFGIFHNPDSGPVFIAGSLVSTFLQQINGKSLATLSSGPYGIFRGIGVSEAKTSSCLKLLNSGAYLLILRGYEDELQELDEILKHLY